MIEAANRAEYTLTTGIRSPQSFLKATDATKQSEKPTKSGRAKSCICCNAPRARPAWNDSNCFRNHRELQLQQLKWKAAKLGYKITQSRQLKEVSEEGKKFKSSYKWLSRFLKCKYFDPSSLAEWLLAVIVGRKPPSW